MDIEAAVREIEDVLFQRKELDVWERALYWHLFRHTHLEGRPTVVTGLNTLARLTGISTTKVRESIRSMAIKGCITVDERNRLGHTIKVLLPAHIPGLATSTESARFDIERRHLQPLMERQQGACFYCLRVLTSESAALDHVVPQVLGGDNSYRNIVVACDECNARKQALAADEYLRLLYRDGLLGQSDLKERLQTLAQITAGALMPAIQGTA